MSTSSFFQSLEELRRLSDAEIEQRIDAQLAGGHMMMTVTFLREELARREGERAARRTIELTAKIWWLTLAVAVATIVALGVSVAALIRG